MTPSLTPNELSSSLKSGQVMSQLRIIPFFAFPTFLIFVKHHLTPSIILDQICCEYNNTRVWWHHQPCSKSNLTKILPGKCNSLKEIPMRWKRITPVLKYSYLMSLDSICSWSSRKKEWWCWDVTWGHACQVVSWSHGAQTTLQRPLKLSPIAGKREKLVLMALVSNTGWHMCGEFRLLWLLQSRISLA